MTTYLERWLLCGLVVDCNPQDMCIRSLDKRAVHDCEDGHLPVLHPVLKLLTDLANAFCLWWCWS
jgi:hypothetical protein